MKYEVTRKNVEAYASWKEENSKEESDRAVDGRAPAAVAAAGLDRAHHVVAPARRSDAIALAHRLLDESEEEERDPEERRRGAYERVRPEIVAGHRVERLAVRGKENGRNAQYPRKCTRRNRRRRSEGGLNEPEDERFLQRQKRRGKHAKSRDRGTDERKPHTARNMARHLEIAHERRVEFAKRNIAA